MLTIYKASAGSGKTYNLAYEYIRDLLGEKQSSGKYRLASAKGRGHRHRHILAITFTNKATEEMKSRIVSELHDIASGNPGASYSDKLVAELHCSPEALAEAASVALGQILFDFNMFNVSTIDSFFQMVLRTFAREVDKPGNFEVELNDKYAVAMGASMMLTDLNTTLTPEASPLGKWIKQFMEDKIDEGEGFDLFNRKGSIHTSMVAFINRINSEDFKDRLDEVVDYLQDASRLDSFRKETVKRIAVMDREAASSSQALLDRLSMDGMAPEAINNTLIARLKKWSAGAVPDFSEDFKSKAVEEVTAGNPDGVVKKQWIKDKKPVMPAVRDLFVVHFSRIRDIAVLREIYKLILNGIYYLGLMGYALKYIDEFRRENNVILLSDTNSLLKTIIGGSETPFVYERIGVELHHFLIDEFQDTSRMQWDILYPLVLNSQAGGYDNLVIGDEKQSIYRFRNADSTLLRRKVGEQFPDSVRRGLRGAENTNHRSRPEIVRFNNSLYTAIAAARSIDTYDNVVQEIPEKKRGLGGCVKLEMFKTSTRGAYEETVLPRVAREILDMHSRGYRFGQIAVLVRRRKEAETVVQYLTRNHGDDIHVMSDESLLLTSCSTIRLIISMLRMVLTARTRRSEVPSDSYASALEVKMILNKVEYHINCGMKPQEAVDMVCDNMSEVDSVVEEIESRRSATLMTLLEHVIDTVVSKEAARRDMAYIVALRDHVADYCSRYGSDLHSFLRWWDTASSKLTIPGADSDDAVRVMTIHKSKGLQMECVILPMLDYDMCKATEEAWYSIGSLPGIDPSLVPPLISIPGRAVLAETGSPVRSEYLANLDAQRLDNLNATYVATTRAISEMVVFCRCSSSDECISSWIADALAAPPAHTGPLFIDLPAGRVETEGDAAAEVIGAETAYVYGSPTSPLDVENPQPEKRGEVEMLVPGPYEPTFRADTQEFTRVPDDAEPEYADTPDDASAPDDGESEQERMRGVVLHHVMSLIHRSADWPHAFERVAHARRLSAAERRDYEEIVRNAFGCPATAAYVGRWFEDFDHCLAERAIYIPEVGRTSRPDRLVWLPDGSVELVDYKFTTRKSPEHANQVRRYCRLLARMGYVNVRPYLWYPMLEEVVEVDMEVQ